MIPEPLWSFMKQLRSATDQKTLQWSEGAASSFVCAHKAYNLHLSKGSNEDDEHWFWFTIKGLDPEVRFRVMDHETDFDFMLGFWSCVTVNANNIEKFEKDFFS